VPAKGPRITHAVKAGASSEATPRAALGVGFGATLGTGRRPAAAAEAHGGAAGAEVQANPGKDRQAAAEAGPSGDSTEDPGEGPVGPERGA